AGRGKARGGRGVLWKWRNNNTPASTIYGRWYSYYSANWVRGIFEKHAIFLRGAPTITADEHAFWVNGHSVAPWEGTAAIVNGNNIYRPQNMNGTQNYRLGAWQCFEVRLTLNSTGSVADGIVEAWIDGVPQWSYPNAQLWQSGTPGPNFNNIEFSAYYNCVGSIGGTTGCHSDPSNAHPDMVRYVDKV